MSKTKFSSEPRVFSYLRFSNPEQELGDSERRQVERAKAFAERVGLQFDESLADRGLSGFHGEHRNRGKLGEFLTRVDSGEVPPGSIMVVENIDRLSRENMVDALETVIFGLIKKGITIQTLFPEATYNRKSLDEGRIWELIAHLNRANAESKRKSDLGQANWERKRRLASEEGRILTRMRPAWLEVVDGRFQVIEIAANIIRQIFQWKADGASTRSIEQRLNRQAAWTPLANPKRKGTGWRDSYLKKLLQFRAVIGEFQPHKKVNGKRNPVGEPIPDYFPPIVDAKLFFVVQKIMDENRGRGGRNGKVVNLFTHLVYCPYCGGSMAFEDKGKPPKGAAYFICDAGRRCTGCARYRIRYDECERLIIESCHKLRPEDIFPGANEQEENVLSLRMRMQGTESEIEDIRSQVENLVNQIGRTKNAVTRDRYEARIAELDIRRETLDQELRGTRREFQELEAAKNVFRDWKETLRPIYEALETRDPEFRLKLRAHMRRLISKIEIFANGHPHPFDIETETGDPIVETVEDMAAMGEQSISITKQREVTEFAEYLLRRRMSKEGRFLRIHFKTGGKIDVVPPGSLASGYEWTPSSDKPSLRTVSPDLESLYREFSDQKGATRMTEKIRSQEIAH